MKRYKLTEIGALDVKAGQASFPIIRLEENESGAWCWYEDVAAIESQLQAAQAENEKLRSQRLISIGNAKENIDVLKEQMEKTKELQAENEALRADNAVLIDMFIASEMDIYHYRCSNCGEFFVNYHNCCGVCGKEGYLTGSFLKNDLKEYITNQLDPHPGAALLQELEALRGVMRALELVCTDLACDDQCPIGEPDFKHWPECENCPGNVGEIHQDTERDAKCWIRFYMDKGSDV